MYTTDISLGPIRIFSFLVPFLMAFLSTVLMTVSIGSAQNLVPNPGFEEYFEESRGQTDIANAKHWSNANKRQNTPLFGTPDHMFAAKNLVGTLRNESYFKPYEGMCTAGLITYMQRVRNYREYLSTRLLKPMQIGNTYEVSCYITNGNHASFGNIGTNGFGILLSEVPIEQHVYEPLAEKPQFMMEEIFYKTEWTKVSFRIKADKAYQYLTMGSFLRDYNTKLRYFNYDIDPQCYLFVDEVSVIEIDPKEDIEEEAPIQQEVKEEEIASVDPEIEFTPPLEGRDIKVQSVFPTNGTDVTIQVWDRREVDGDVISLQLNGKWILREYSLKKSKKKITVDLEPGGENLLVFFAHTLGTVPPNTAAIKLKSGKIKRTLNITSDLNYCGAIQLVE